MHAICLPRKNRSEFWARCSSTLALFLKFDCVLWSFSKAEAIIALSISKSRKLGCPVNRFSNLNFFDPEHSDLRIGCSISNLSSEVHRVRQCSKIPFRKRKSRIIHHTSVRISFTSMIQHSTYTLEVRWLSRRIQWFAFHLSFSPCCLWNIKFQILRWRCQILWSVEDCER